MHFPPFALPHGAIFFAGNRCAYLVGTPMCARVLFFFLSLRNGIELPTTFPPFILWPPEARNDTHAPRPIQPHPSPPPLLTSISGPGGLFSFFFFSHSLTLRLGTVITPQPISMTPRSFAGSSVSCFPFFSGAKCRRPCCIGPAPTGQQLS